MVVDGSNIATEGRSTPSLAQLDDAVRQFEEQFPGTQVIVVVDATFGHRIDLSERAAFDEAAAHAEILSPPAGAIGRGDAFLLRVAERVGAQVLSNDSFQEFHGEHPWLFDAGRLIGGTPVPGVGWIFTPRSPVRGARSRASITASAKAAETAKAAKKPSKVSKSAKSAKSAKLAEPAQTAVPAETAKTAKKVAGAAKTAKAAAAKAEKAVKAAKGEKAAKTAKPQKAAKAQKLGKSTTTAKTVKTAKSPKTAKTARTAKASGPAKTAKASRTTKAAKAAGPTTARGADVEAAIEVATEEVLVPGDPPMTQTEKGRRRRRKGPPPAVNEPLAFLRFVTEHPVGSEVEGIVVSFTSHGAMVDVGNMHCYAPVSGLGDPAPRKAREVLERGESRRFVLVGLDPPRRGAELALPGMRKEPPAATG